MKIVYTPFHGTGLRLVPETLRRAGFENVICVKEQMIPDGRFPTVESPNPEYKKSFQMAIKLAEETGSELVIGTDPDADRVGVCVRNEKGEFIPLTGNQSGAILLEYLITARKANGTLPKNACVVKTIVTSELGTRICEANGIKIMNVLTGFKFIGEQIGFLEADGEVDRYIFGFEESYGYLSGGHVRDKDGVNASLLICEMFAHYKAMGISLVQMLNQLYEKYGYFKEALQSITFEGASGAKKMADLMESLRTNAPKEVAGYKVIDVKDYKAGIGNLPKSNVLEFNMEDDINVLVRPSGTEPKIKMYYLVKGSSEQAGAEIVAALESYFTEVCK